MIRLTNHSQKDDKDPVNVENTGFSLELCPYSAQRNMEVRNKPDKYGDVLYSSVSLWIRLYVNTLSSTDSVTVCFCIICILCLFCKFENQCHNYFKFKGARCDSERLCLQYR